MPSVLFVFSSVSRTLSGDETVRSKDLRASLTLTDIYVQGYSIPEVAQVPLLSAFTALDEQFKLLFE